MKLAIIAVTDNGADLAVTLAQKLTGIDCAAYVKSGRSGSATAEQAVRFDVLRELVDNIIGQYDGFVFVMAAGIAVRMIALHIVHKQIDPAVVVVDEQGKFAVSLLSGHIGGANRLAALVAGTLGCQPVITTATDVNDKPALDVIATDLRLRIEPFTALKNFNAAIVAGKPLDFYIDDTVDSARYSEYLNRLGLNWRKLQNRDHAALTGTGRLSAIITDDNADAAAYGFDIVRLTPRRLTAGIGCRRGATLEELTAALTAACTLVGHRPADIISLGTTTVKRDETGLLELGRVMNIPITFYDNDALQSVIEQYNLPTSNFVNTQIGVGNVCEAAALLNSQIKKLVLRKHKFPKVAIALAWVR